MNCRDFQNEFDGLDRLSENMRLHLEVCPECREFQIAQTSLFDMLGNLERVSVPNDFDIQLRKRIAAANSVKENAGFFPSLRFAFPLALSLVVISIIAFGGLFLVNRNSNDRVAEAETPKDNPVAESPLQPANTVAAQYTPIPESMANSSVSDDKLVADGTLPKAKLSPAKENSIPKPVEKDSGGGFKDMAVTSVPPLIQPEFDSNREVRNPSDIGATTIAEIADILRISGITLEGLKVVSVRKDSVADRSGVLPGDIVDEINGKKLTGNSISGKQINVNSLTVLREASKREIILVNK